MTHITYTKIPTSDPEAFGEWVRNVASINEQFSEVLHNSADIIATIDPNAAYSLYQAADRAYATVQRLRDSVPASPPPLEGLQLAAYRAGAFCGRLAALAIRRVL